MINIDTFRKHLEKPITLSTLKFTHIGNDGKDLEQWADNLNLLSHKEQYFQLEKVLSELLIANISDERRMQIMFDIQAVVRQLVGKIHSEYVHEPANLSATQMQYVNQVKSIYFLSALVYNGVLERQIQLVQVRNHKPKLSFKSLIFAGQSQNNISQKAIYFLMQSYLHILMEDALIFEKSSDYIWQQLNSLYLYSIQENIANAKIRAKFHLKDADTIHEYFLQACLYSLLRPASYRRQDILSLHKVLDEWTRHVTIESNVDSESKIFVDLNSFRPPEYLTPYSKVNPFDKLNVCVFVFIDHLLKYLESVQDETNPDFKPSYKVRLAKLSEYTLKQQQFKLRAETRHPTTARAYLVIGLHRIHHHLSGKQPFGMLIDKASLQLSYHPKMRTNLNLSDYENMTPMVVSDKSNAGYRFRSNNRSIFDSETDKEDASSNKYSSLLKVLSLFAVAPDPKDPNSTWELGMIRWIEHEDTGIQAGSRIIGYSLTACGVRLENKDERSQDFVPALLVAGNETLETSTNLILPHYHFKEDDRIVLRIGNKETKLKLSKNLLNTDDIQQYEIVRLAN